MKILNVASLEITDVKVIRFARFSDHRGYFSEHFRKSDFLNHPDIPILDNSEFVQSNESFSNKDTIRGLHYQWNPYMGKLVRTIHGHMIDMALDIRKESSTFGKIICYDMPAKSSDKHAEWIWVPPGFAHGNFFLEDSYIEYYCSGEYSPGCEAGISPLAKDIDWSMCDQNLAKQFNDLAEHTQLITDKDKDGHTLESWVESENSDQFIYGKL